jgi:hypothetical protein
MATLPEFPTGLEHRARSFDQPIGAQQQRVWDRLARALSLPHLQPAAGWPASPWGRPLFVQLEAPSGRVVGAGVTLLLLFVPTFLRLVVVDTDCDDLVRERPTQSIAAMTDAPGNKCKINSRNAKDENAFPNFNCFLFHEGSRDPARGITRRAGFSFGRQHAARLASGTECGVLHWGGR